MSHSLPQRTYSANGYQSRTAYDDVFGGPPKFGVPTLSPRAEDYSEIFGSFRSPRGSSIPVLEPPAAGGSDSDLCFDVRSSEFDYSEVFGGFDGLEFAVDYEDLFRGSDGGDDSSEDAWTPAQSESLSDESDPSASSERNQSLSNGDAYQSFDGTKQFNLSYHKAKPKGKEDVLNGTVHVTPPHAVPGYTYVVTETHPLQKIENDSYLVIDDQNVGVDFGGGFTQGKRLIKTMSQPSDISFGMQTCGDDLNHRAGHGKVGFPRNVPFVSVSDISLRTQPTHMPPPSRPPPPLAGKSCDGDRPNAKLKASESYAFERIAGDNSPPYFDVEIDASSSAAASAAAMKDAVEKAQEKLRSANKLRERKKEGLQSRMKLRLETDTKDKEGRVCRPFNSSNSKDERLQGPCEREGENLEAAEESAERKNWREHRSFQGSHKIEDNVAWREASEFYEVAEKEHVKDEKDLLQTSKSREHGREEKKPVLEEIEQPEYARRIKAARETGKREENENRFNVAKGACEWDEKGTLKATNDPHGQEEYQKKASVGPRPCESKQNVNQVRVAHEDGEIKNKPSEGDKCKGEDLMEEQLKENEEEAKTKPKETNEKIKKEKKLKDAREREENERTEHERGLNKAAGRVDHVKIQKESLDQEGKEKQRREARKREEVEKKQNEACELENEKKLEEALNFEEHYKRSKEAFEQEESESSSKPVLEREENEKEQKLACKREQNEKWIRETLWQEEYEKNLKEALEQEENTKIYEGEEGDKKLHEACGEEDNETGLTEVSEQQEGNTTILLAHEREKERRTEGIEKRTKGTTEWEESEKTVKDSGNQENLRGQNKDHKQTDVEANERTLNLNQKIHVPEHRHTVEASDGVRKMDNYGTSQPTAIANEHDKNSTGLEPTQEAYSCEEEKRFSTEINDFEKELEAVEETHKLSGIDQIDSRLQKAKDITGNSLKSLHLHESKVIRSGSAIDTGDADIEHDKNSSEMTSDPEKVNILAHREGETVKTIKEVRFAFDDERSKDKSSSSQVVREWVEHGRKIRDTRPAVLERKVDASNTAKRVTSQSVEREEKTFDEDLISGQREFEERLRKRREMENDRLRKIEEEREREREREKDRMAVDRATYEARERAYAEARDRAERAAVERATAEARQRAMLEARGRSGKASSEARERSLAEKASAEARLRAERAAVERATAEARERAIEKTMAERAVADRFSAINASSGMRQSSIPSDLQFQSVGTRYSHYSVHGVESESPQRCKARLERHQRTAERAAKALVEKNMRDLLAQREQAERHRLAVALDADVKRWSSGKEGNLRALLSTLQYILGPDSGWHPVPLTDVVTAVAAKKAYRKATLCVHPDKLQQRGATIQQKYICEKVFDLLKEAWNKFNSEER